MKPRKIKQKPPEPEPEPQKDDIEDDDIPPEGVKSETRSEKIVVEKGKKKRIIKITRIMEDGSKETETIKEAVSDDED